MNVAARSPVAMILPLPVPPRPGDDALRFIDMKGYPRFFHDLDAAFPALALAASRGGFGASGVAPERPTLTVHEVGDFVASFVPSLADFDRLDARFRLSDAVWEALPIYADYGFAVFQLKDLGPGGWLRRLFGRAAARTIHPMAFEFPRRDPDVLFFPPCMCTTARCASGRRSITISTRSCSKVRGPGAAGPGCRTTRR